MYRNSHIFPLKSLKGIIKSKLCMLLVFQFIAFSLIGQSAKSTITGTIIDDQGVPVIGANVLVRGTQLGTITDFDGKYSILASEDDVLLISYIGYADQEIKVGGQRVIDLTIAEDAQKLDEVIVVGYGNTKRSDITGAVASVSEEKLRNSVTTNIDQALQGRVAGVQITQNSGAPGGAASIRIRGANSISGSSEPLYVIDGIPFSGAGASSIDFSWTGGEGGQSRINPLSTINPNDIINIEVLKDASASAIYGARAANGVVLVTTKRGKKGESKIAYNAYYGLQNLAKKLPIMDLPQFADYQRQVSEDINQQVNQRYEDASLLGRGTDWQDEIFRQAGMKSHQLSVSGGNDKTTYAISGGYFQQDGIVIGSEFDRISSRINLENQVKDWVKIGGSLAFTKTREKITLNDGGGGVIMQALINQPDVAVRDANGDFAGPENVFGASYNPVADALQRTNGVKRDRLMGNIHGDFSLLKGLTYRSEIGFDQNASLAKAFRPTYQYGARINNQNGLRQDQGNGFFWVVKNYLTYNTKIADKHDISAMIGQEAQKSVFEGTSVQKYNFASNDIQVLNQGDQVNSQIGGYKGANSLASYFTRVNYGLSDKYLVTLTMRADASSRFGPNNKWGFFPAASFAYRLSEEGFMQNQDFISNLKLRLGYGEVGNQSIGDYRYGATLVGVQTPFGTAYRPSNIANPDLKWEATTQWNLGLDFSLLSGRVDMTVDVYNKQTRGMLLQPPIPRYLGGTGGNDISAPFANIGSLENKGIDLSITTRNIVRKKVSWDTDVNFSLNRNKVLELDIDATPFFEGLYWYSGFQQATITTVGKPIGQFYGFVTDGIFKNEAEILAAPVQVVDDNSVNDANPNGVNLVDKSAGVWIGDMKFKDVNNDGVINSGDRTFIGDPNPDFTFGVNNQVTVGAFDLSVFLTGSYGAKIFNYSRVQIEGMTSVFQNQSRAVFDRAQFSYLDPLGSTADPANTVLINPDTDIPRPTTTDNNGNTRMSDRFIEDGSYIRLQNVKLSYEVPSNKLNATQLGRLRFYISGQNLKTWTNYSGYDPEIGAFNQSPLRQNIDIGRYPTPKVWTFGLDLEF